MRGLLLTVILLAMTPAVLASEAGTSGEAGIAVIVTHPFPDDADPLGFPFRANVDGHLLRHSYRSPSMAYPHIVIDGVAVINGLPDASRPQVAMDENLTTAIEARRGIETPIELNVSARYAQGAVAGRIELTPRGTLAAGTLWIAVTEDHVAFRPPAAVSNGVFNHRFTLRALAEVGTTQLETPSRHNISIALPDLNYDAEQLALVAWVQADASGARFAPNEILQAATLPLGSNGPGAITQTERAVLIEMRSATWCDPCLFGDRAVERAAQDYGLISDQEVFETTYWRTPASPAMAIVAGVLGAALMFWRGRP